MNFYKNISKTFLVFLGMSLLIWLLITLSKEYVTQVSLNVSYKALPQNKKLQKEPLKEIKVIAKGTGFKILSTRFFNHSIQLKTQGILKNESKKSFLLLSNQRLDIQKQLVKGVRLEAFLKDTIYFDIGELISKKVPVNPNVTIDFHIGFDALKPIEIQPDSVLISGSKLALASIHSITSEELFLEDVSADFSKKVALIKPKNTENVKLNVKEVLVKGNVEKFTEANFIVPFSIDNLPEDVRLITFPKDIKVVFKVDLPRFNNVSENSFKVICDYQFSEANGFNYLVPKIVLQPDFVKHVRLVPNKIEYLIHK